MSLSNKTCIIRPAVVDLNPVEVNYHLFMISLDLCNGSCNVVHDLFANICLPSITKNVNVKVFKTKTRIKEVKALIKHI